MDFVHLIFGILLVFTTSPNTVSVCSAAEQDLMDMFYSKNFKYEKFLGDWYIFKRGPNSEKQVEKINRFECLIEHYSDNPKNAYVVDYTFSLREWSTGNVSVEHGFTTFNTRFNSKATTYFYGTAVEGNVVASDYDNWALIQSVEKVKGKESQVFWILSRTPKLNKYILATIEAFLVSFGVDTENMIEMKNDNCQNDFKPSNVQVNYGTSEQMEKSPITRVVEIIQEKEQEIKRKIEQAQGKPINEFGIGKNGNRIFEPISFRRQIVAGENYFIKVKILGNNGNAIWHIKIHENWRQGAIILVKVKGPFGINQPIEYF